LEHVVRDQAERFVGASLRLLPDGSLKERLIRTADEATIAVALTERPWAFDGDGAAFQLAFEAKRIDLAFLFDPMMAVHTSKVDPLPHRSPQCMSRCCLVSR
jgi:hypothetical protein